MNFYFWNWVIYLKILIWILNNKEWLFSGIGVVVFTFVASRIFNNKKEESKEVTSSKSLDLEITNFKIADQTEVEAISDRFNVCLKLMNTNRNSDPLTIAWIAKQLKLQRISDLEDVFLGKNEATFELIEKFSEIFGINAEWLLEGKGQPFKIKGHRKLLPLEYFDEIKSSEADGIFFVRANTIEGQTIIVLKLSEYKFMIFEKDWHISDQIGGTGQHQLLSFYELINKLIANRLAFKCYGIILEKGDFYKLQNGEIFPGEFLNKMQLRNAWWEDLLDFQYSFRSKELYKLKYGESFIRAQEVLRILLRVKSL